MRPLGKVRSILSGGLVAAALDGLDAVVFYGLWAGVTPTRIFQGIASGLLGRASFSGGAATVALGILCHVTIALAAAAVFGLAAEGIPALARHPWVSGPIFGLGVYLFMNDVVLPLSAVARRTHPRAPADLADQLFAHTLLIGLPIALFASRARRPEPLESAPAC